MTASLYLRGSRAPGHKCLTSRTHDLSGTDYEYITSLTDEAAKAFNRGADFLVRLIEDAEPGTAAWRVFVVEGKKEFPGLRLSDDRLSLLCEAGSSRVTIEGGELSHASRALQIAREQLAEAERVVTLAQARIVKIEEKIAVLSAPDEAPEL